MTMRRSAKPFGRGFTVLELLVVVGIIMLMTALALPAVSTFLRGQRLQQSGRIMQSAFNEARRAAITQRTKQYLLFFRNVDELGQELLSAQRYRDRQGWEGEPFNLLPGVEFETEASTIPGSSKRIKALKLPIFDQRPLEDDANLFQDRRPKKNAGLAWIEFRKDGTIDLMDAPLTNQNQPSIAPNLFDLNSNVQLNETQLDNLVDQVDMSLREAGGGQVNKRCFIDIDPNTGRVRFRVVEGINLSTPG